MKRRRLISLLLVISLFLALPFSAAFGQADVKKVNLTENQKNILKAYGLSEKEIENIDIETIRNTLRNGVVVDSEKFAEKPDRDRNRLTTDLKEKLAQKGLSDVQINSLGNLGYTYEEIANMEPALIETLVWDATIMYTMPSDYVGPVSVPDGGGDEEYFHKDIAIEESDLNWYASASKQYAINHFAESNTDNMLWSYYLYGEWSDIYQTHQGVDVSHSNGRTVYNVTGTAIRKGEVVDAFQGGGVDGAVLVYDDYLDETSIYLHIGIPSVQKGDWVEAGDEIGYQSYLKGHTHFQAQDGKFDPDVDQIEPATYDKLNTRIPYGFMTWYL